MYSVKNILACKLGNAHTHICVKHLMVTLKTLKLKPFENFQLHGICLVCNSLHSGWFILRNFLVFHLTCRDIQL